jgi:hypothetical protein
MLSAVVTAPPRELSMKLVYWYQIKVAVVAAVPEQDRGAALPRRGRSDGTIRLLDSV